MKIKRIRFLIQVEITVGGGKEFSSKLSVISANSKDSSKFEDLPKEWKVWTEKDWKNTEACEICKMIFKGIGSRHHCRRCGFCVCNECSTKKRRLSKIDPNFYRICENCDNYFANKQTEEALLSISAAKEQTLNETLDQLQKTISIVNDLNIRLNDKKVKVEITKNDNKKEKFKKDEEELLQRCTAEEKNLKRSLDAKKSLNKAVEQNMVIIRQKEDKLKEMEKRRDEM